MLEASENFLNIVRMSRAARLLKLIIAPTWCSHTDWRRSPANICFEQSFVGSITLFFGLVRQNLRKNSLGYLPSCVVNCENLWVSWAYVCACSLAASTPAKTLKAVFLWLQSEIIFQMTDGLSKSKESLEIWNNGNNTFCLYN